MTEKRKSPIQAISLMMIITLLGKVSGLLRDRLLTVNYGSTAAANAFLTASRIPRVFFDAIFASAIAACFIPVFSEYLVKEGKKKAYQFAGNFISVIGILTLGITILGMIFSEQLAVFFADGFDADASALCAELTRIMFPTVVFTGIAYSFVGILQSLDEFNIPSMISLVSNIIIILYYIFLNDKFGIYGLAIAFLFAWLAQALVQLPSLKKRGFEYRPSLSIRSEGMRKVFRLMLPVLISTWVIPINQTVNSKFGSRLFDGAGVSAIELSYNLYTIIVGVFVLSVTNFVFPRLARQSAENDTAAAKKTISSAMHVSMFLVIPMMLGLMIMSRPVVNFIYGGGEFDSFSVDITARALLYLSLGMIGYAIQTVLGRAYFAEQRGKMPLISGAVAILVNIILSVLLTEKYDVAGLGIASALSSTVNGLLLMFALQKSGKGFLSKSFLIDMLKITLATAFMGVAAYAAYRLCITAEFGKLLTVLIPVALGAVVYFIITVLLRLPEAKMAISYAKKLVKR